MGRVRLSVVFGLLTLVAGPATRAQGATASGRLLTLPDGSTLYLLPRPGRPVVHWATWVDMGRVHEPPGTQGMAEACLLASLGGDARTGTADWDKERVLLERIDDVGRELDEARRKGADAGRIAALEERLDGFRAGLRVLQRPLELRERLATLPVVDLEVRGEVEGSWLVMTTATSRLGELATMMAERRERTVLRGFHEALAEVRARLAEAPAEPFLAEARLQALQVHPLRGARGLPRFVPWQEARSFWRRHHRPERIVTVLVGAFDADRVAETMRSLFTAPAHPGERPPPLPVEPAQPGFRESFLELGGDPRLVVAWRVPDGTARADLEVLGRVLADGADSMLARALRTEPPLAATIEAFPCHPARMDPCLFMLRLTGTEWNRARYEALLAEGRKVFDRVREDGVDAGLLGRAIDAWSAERRLRDADPRELAMTIAHRLALTGEPAAVPPDAERCQALAKALFDRRRLTMVSTALDLFEREAGGEGGGR
ncbi:MAG: insulinase family protein [Planctomycetota bacterium]